MRTVRVIFVLSLAFSAFSELPNGIYKIALDANSRHELYWSVDYDKSIVKFEVHARIGKSEWFALGFSDRGSMEEGDYCIFYQDGSGLAKIADISTDDKCLVSLNEDQHCKNFDYKIWNSFIKFTYTREFDTCDPYDYIIEEGTTHIVWASGKGLVKNRKLCDRGEQGMVRTQLLKNENESPVLPDSTWSYEATVSLLKVPSSDTTYWCHLVEMPERLTIDHHVMEFESIITKGNEGLVHHMELFHCEGDRWQILPKYSGPCDKKPKPLEICKKVIAAWAMGAPRFKYPQEAGLPVGGSEFSLYAMLEVHYNNPGLKSDWIDSSGLKVFLSPELRQYDAGAIELGLEYIDKMAIPPHQENFQLSGYCIAECTAVALPPNGIIIFGSQLHTHLTGTKVETRHIRHGTELAKLNHDYHYSTHFQEIRLLKNQVNLLPGDALVTTCTYNTVSRNNITLGGFAITDEMCVNYIYYYPKVDLEVCKSSISDRNLADYFDNLRRWELQKTSSELPISESYNAIEWNPMRVKILDNLYKESTIYMQCNRSNGDRFSGNWEKMPVTDILVPFEEMERDCENAV